MSSIFGAAFHSATVGGFEAFEGSPTKTPRFPVATTAGGSPLAAAGVEETTGADAVTDVDAITGADAVLSASCLAGALAPAAGAEVEEGSGFRHPEQNSRVQPIPRERRRATGNMGEKY
jgi:hypothetical protein